MKQLGNILLVDDDAVTNFINQTIIRQSGVVRNVEAVTSGQKALDMIWHRCLGANAKECFDLVLLDINMPGMTGFEVLEGLESYRHALELHLPVIVMLSSSADPQDQAQARLHRVAGYLVKPLTREKVQDLLHWLSG